MPIDQDAWPHCGVVKESFLSAVSEITHGANGSSESDEEVYQTLFEDNNKDDGSFINPQSLLRMPGKRRRLRDRFKSKS